MEKRTGAEKVYENNCFAMSKGFIEMILQSILVLFVNIYCRGVGSSLWLGGGLKVEAND